LTLESATILSGMGLSPISLDQAADEFGIGKSTLGLWLRQGHLTRLPPAVAEWRGIVRQRAMVDPAELARQLARTNPRYLGSRKREAPNAP
jgi:hypothetical protein